jgi:hypothetical protein
MNNAYASFTKPPNIDFAHFRPEAMRVKPLRVFRFSGSTPMRETEPCR